MLGIHKILRRDPDLAGNLVKWVCNFFWIQIGQFLREKHKTNITNALKTTKLVLFLYNSGYIQYCCIKGSGSGTSNKWTLATSGWEEGGWWGKNCLTIIFGKINTIADRDPDPCSNHDANPDPVGNKLIRICYPWLGWREGGEEVNELSLVNIFWKSCCRIALVDTSMTAMVHILDGNP